jgi:Spy/CpxP family protein refolding chaperone
LRTLLEHDLYSLLTPEQRTKIATRAASGSPQGRPRRDWPQ